MSDDITVTEQELLETATYLLYATGMYLGGDRSIFEMLGGATAILSEVAKDEIENEQKTKISEGTSATGVAGGPSKVLEVGEPGGNEESTQGTSDVVTGETQGDSKTKSPSKS